MGRAMLTEARKLPRSEGSSLIFVLFLLLSLYSSTYHAAMELKRTTTVCDTYYVKVRLHIFLVLYLKIESVKVKMGIQYVL